VRRPTLLWRDSLPSLALPAGLGRVWRIGGGEDVEVRGESRTLLVPLPDIGRGPVRWQEVTTSPPLAGELPLLPHDDDVLAFDGVSGKLLARGRLGMVGSPAVSNDIRNWASGDTRNWTPQACW
jgi:hypothetical protein